MESFINYFKIFTKLEKSLIKRELGWAEYHEFCEVNRDQPGYFDMVIPCDSQEHAHHSIRELVLDFLNGQFENLLSLYNLKFQATIKNQQHRYLVNVAHDQQVNLGFIHS